MAHRQEPGPSSPVRDAQLSALAQGLESVALPVCLVNPQLDIVFGNRADALVAMANRAAGESLADVPGFAAFRERLTPRDSSGLYSDGSPAAEAARSALREVILALGE